MNLKKKISNFGVNILAYVFILGFIITTTGLGYRGKYKIPDDPNWSIVVFGLIVLIPFIIIFFISNHKLNKQGKKELLEIKSLKESGIRADIDLTELEIIQNENVLPPINKVTINKYGEANFQTILSLNNKINYTFYTDINKDNLKIYFALNPKTCLFTDKKNKHKQYIDLEFLEK